MTKHLNGELGIPGSVRISAGNGGLPMVMLTHASGSSAEVYLHGAHIASWKNRAGEELLFLSRESHWAEDKPIRGGIPVIFPQFGGRGPLPQHGFARTSAWQLLSTELLDSGVVSVELKMNETDVSLAIWPHRYVLRMNVLLDANVLAVGVRVTNTGDQPFDFQTALHTYFRVADIGRTAVVGLRGVTYTDSLLDDVSAVEDRDTVLFDQETDRVYIDAPDLLRVEDECGGRTIAVEKRNMPDVVVWNPWIAKSRRMPDFGDDEYLRMVCVETGAIETRPSLFPGESWDGETTFLSG